MQVSECPICGGKLQATVERYYSNVVINKYGAILESTHVEELGEEERVYCENDCTLDEILEALGDEEE